MSNQSQGVTVPAADRMPFHLAWLFAVAMLVSCLAPKTTWAQSKSQPSKFFLGADITALDAPGRGQWAPLAYQEDGKPSDEITILVHHGWTAFRVRVFLSPVRRAPNNTLENALPLAKKIKSTGATLLLSMHFSDTWPDR
jgi:arabinogalactan endo-1,4-beta-galactosidase